MAKPISMLSWTRIVTGSVVSHTRPNWRGSEHYLPCNVILRSPRLNIKPKPPNRLHDWRAFHTDHCLAAGHSHWANIKVGKMSKDAERSYNFTKMGNLMRAAVRSGGADPVVNHQLARLIIQAKEMDMPKATLERILSPKTTGEHKPSFFEIKGPALASVIIVEAISPNPRKTEIDLRTIMKKNGGQLQQNAGLLNYFQHKGIIIASKHDTTEEQATDDGIQVGAEEVALEDAEAAEGKGKLVTQFRFECAPMDIVPVRRRLEEAGYSILHAAAEYIPLQTLELTGKEAQIFSSLVEKIEEHPDVSQVFTNVS